MITLFRWYLLKRKEIKWKLGLYQFLDQIFGNISIEELQKKFVHEFAQIIHKENSEKDDKDSE